MTSARPSETLRLLPHILRPARPVRGGGELLQHRALIEGVGALGQALGARQAPAQSTAYPQDR